MNKLLIQGIIAITLTIALCVLTGMRIVPIEAFLSIACLAIGFWFPEIREFVRTKRQKK